MKKPNEKLKIIGKWDDDLIWCPSQCFLSVQFNNKDYTVYLRWRWQNPWKGYVWAGGRDELRNKWSPNLFAKYHIQFSDEELKLAKKEIVKLAERWLNNI